MDHLTSQLFGDTMTTANIILANSKSGQVHLSEATAKLLMKHGKQAWVNEREDKIQTYDRGEMQTFWLAMGLRDSQSQKHFPENGESDSSIFFDGTEGDATTDQQSEERWIEWNVSVFVNLLKQIEARRATLLKFQNDFGGRPAAIETAAMPLEEVKEIIELPAFDKRATKRQRDNQDVEISETVLEQLKQYVTEIANKYNNNHFHNFAHASYVVCFAARFAD